MAHVQQLENYFGNTGKRGPSDRRVGSEVETFFTNSSGSAISIEQSQRIMCTLVEKSIWRIASRKGDFVTEITLGDNRLLYELGYPNLELSVGPTRPAELIRKTRELLQFVYNAAEDCGAYPVFEPIYRGDGNYLAMPDERDATWLALDGKKALSPLAQISAVQFTVDTSVRDALRMLRSLQENRSAFLATYPQDAVWREYVRTSLAGYREDRYGGPEQFDTLEAYVSALAQHDVVAGDRLVPFCEAKLESNTDIELFLRSIWWYFRLRRYGGALCIEVRPIPRRSDEALQQQLDMVMSLVT